MEHVFIYRISVILEVELLATYYFFKVFFFFFFDIVEAVAAGKGKSSLAAPKKNGAGFGSRKALHDITNKSKLQPQASSTTRKDVEGVDFDIAKEGFLHDHSKCIEEQQQDQWDSYFSEHIILHGHGNNDL